MAASYSSICQPKAPSAVNADQSTTGLPYPINGSWQNRCYNNSTTIDPPGPGQEFFGQDAQTGNKPALFKDNDDGTITDRNTGLMWVKNRGVKVTWEEAVANAGKCAVGNYHDWRMPTIKDLYSLIDFNGHSGFSAEESIPYIDTRFFEISFGNTANGERLIDAQDWSATEYVGKTMLNNSTVFGYNFIDGRIKGYPKFRPQASEPNKLYVRYVRGNPLYGLNDLADNGNGTITDKATGLMWTKDDSGSGMNWKDALAWVQKKNSENYLGYSDWKLPNAKELQSIVDYSRAPDVTHSPAINPVFNCTVIKNEGGKDDYPFYWTGTTHLEGRNPGVAAVYLCFGRGLGFMRRPIGGNPELTDVHGAGCQRSDPKTGNPADFPTGRGPQGDVIRILNYVRMVRTIR